MRLKSIVLSALFLGTIIAANEALARWGVVPIGFGLMAPAGVYFAGLAFGLRDALHEVAGRVWVIGCIVAGSLLSWLISDSATVPGGLVSIALASGIAYLFSESADLLVYEPLRERNWPAAVGASNVVGAVVDSAVFLWLAFGSLEFMFGQVVGKAYMIALALPIVWWARRQRHSTTEPAFA